MRHETAAGPAAELERARQLLRLGRFQEAIELLKSIWDDTHWPEALLQIGEAYLAQSQWDLAVDTAERVIGQQPEASEAYVLLARALLGRRSSSKALAAARRAVELAPENPRALAVLAAAQARRRDKTDAQATVGRALALEPGSITSHMLAASLACRRKKWGEAELHYRAALAVDPENWPAINNLAACVQKQGRERETNELLRRAAHLAPGQSLVTSNLYLSTNRRLGLKYSRRRYRLAALGALIAVGAVLRSTGNWRAAFWMLPAEGLVVVISFVVAPLVVGYRARRLPADVGRFHRYEWSTWPRRRRRWLVGAAAVGLFALSLALVAQR